MRFPRQVQVSFFFLREDFERKKGIKMQNKRFPLLKSFCARKKLLPLLPFVSLILFC